MNNQLDNVMKKNKTGGCCCSNKILQSNASDSSTNDNSDLPLQKLSVEGASCGGCVGKIEKALLTISDVKTAKMELSTGIATVTGTADIQSLIGALESVGFHAKVN
jgi:Cu+-exporting ATPase